MFVILHKNDRILGFCDFSDIQIESQQISAMEELVFMLVL